MYLIATFKLKVKSQIININSDHKLLEAIDGGLHGGAEEGVGGDEAVGEPPHHQRLQGDHREQQPDLPLPVILNSVHLESGQFQKVLQGIGN